MSKWDVLLEFPGKTAYASLKGALRLPQSACRQTSGTIGLFILMSWNPDFRDEVLVHTMTKWADLRHILCIVQVASSASCPYFAQKVHQTPTLRSHSCAAFPVEFLSPKKCPPSTHYQDCGHFFLTKRVNPNPVTAVRSFGIFQKWNSEIIICYLRNTRLYEIINAMNRSINNSLLV